MKKIGLLAVTLLFFPIVSFGQGAALVWTKPTGGKNYQLFSIKQPNGGFIGICRGAYQGGLYPGKLVNKKCSIGHGGKEVVLNEFEVFELDANPSIKINDSWKGSQFEVGYESTGQKVYLCYGIYQNTYQPGKSVGGKCFFTWNGAEIQATNFLSYFYEARSSTTPTPTPAYRPSSAPVYQPKAVPGPAPTLTEAEKAKLAKTFYDNAIYNFRGDKFEAAAHDLTEYLKLYPNNADVYFNRGIAYQRAGKNELAKADLEKALQLKPDFPAAKTQLERLMTTPKEENVTSISQVRDVKPTDGFYNDLRSLIEKYGIRGLTTNYQYDPNRDLTLSEYTKFIKQAKEILKNSASGFGTKKVDEEKLFNSKCSFSGPFLYSIPETEIARSLACIFKIEKLSVEPAARAATRGKFSIFLNKAIEQASLKITISQQSENVTDNLFLSDKKEPAQPASPKQAANSQTDWTRFLKAGTDKMKARDYDGAIKAYTDCLNVTRSIWCYRSRGTAYALKKQYSLAIADFDEAIKINSEEAEIFSARALLRMETKDMFGALSDIEKAVDLDPKNPQMYLDRASIFCRIKEYRIFVKQDEDKARALGGKVLNPCKLD